MWKRKDVLFILFCILFQGNDRRKKVSAISCRIKGLKILQLLEAQYKQRWKREDPITVNIGFEKLRKRRKHRGIGKSANEKPPSFADVAEKNRISIIVNPSSKSDFLIVH